MAVNPPKASKEKEVFSKKKAQRCMLRNFNIKATETCQIHSFRSIITILLPPSLLMLGDLPKTANKKTWV